MAKEVEEDTQTDRKGMIGKMGGRDQKKVEQDYELFLRDLEEDPEMRAGVNLYKTDGAGAGLSGGKNRTLKKARKAAQASEQQMDMDEEYAIFLFSEAVYTFWHMFCFTSVAASEITMENEEDEADFPEIALDELLDDFDELKIDEEEGEPEESIW